MTERSPIFFNTRKRDSLDPQRDADYRAMRMIHELARLMGLGVTIDMAFFGERIAGVQNIERSFKDAREAAREILNGLSILRERDDDGRWVVRFDRDPADVEVAANEWLDERFGVNRKTPEELAERAEYRAKLRAMGFCQECKKGPLYEGSPYCPEHRERRLHALAKWKRKLKRMGLCLWCSDAPAEPGKTLCAVCARAGRESAMATRDRRLSAGLCQGCGEPRDRDGVYCMRCIEKQHRRKLDRPEGMCSRCVRKPARPGFKMCEECTQKAGADRDRYRDKTRVQRKCGCGAVLPPRGRMCKDCLAQKRRDVANERYQERLKAGLCVACGAEPQDEASIVGRTCRERRAAAKRLKSASP